ncbi:MAG TPA: helix-turn-helix domain-containing protein [Noviherbaspirillum sp.]|uniref:GlxA family transcriptional regulator n=1 Tax=Noviherbaspirillum sp. TaxID=1926288 RepID=UPI002B47D7DA|nr:helix-turn-helix domain-containing protein [Noviherbaspirillum sp.]HJV84158.1 helix-turn-helix domain-containing protein [Noviherbaspirillum sp.]
MKTILVLALEGVMDSSLAITLDTIRAGQAFLSGARKPGRVQLLVAGHKKSIRTGGGLRLNADLTFAEVPGLTRWPDWIVIPGLGLVSDKAIGSRLQKKDAMAAMALLRMAPRSVRVGASCSSVFLLADTGLLSGRNVTMTWWLAHLFRARHPDVRLDETKMLVRDGPILTAGSAYAQLDLMLAIVTDCMGTSIAHLCSRYLIIDQRPSQARYMIHAHAQHVDPTVVAAERWIDAHLAGPISIADLAAELAVSPKTLARRIEAATGLSPVKFLQRRRLLHASHLIETTSMSIEAVAARVGYQDGTALRKLVRREFGTTPGALRS